MGYTFVELSEYIKHIGREKPTVSQPGRLTGTTDLESR